MAMDASEIERLIKEGIPDAKVEITDLRGDGDHYAAMVVSASAACACPANLRAREPVNEFIVRKDRTCLIK